MYTLYRVLRNSEDTIQGATECYTHYTYRELQNIRTGALYLGKRRQPIVCKCILQTNLNDVIRKILKVEQLFLQVSSDANKNIELRLPNLVGLKKIRKLWAKINEYIRSYCNKIYTYI